MGVYDINGMMSVEEIVLAKLFWATVVNGYMLLNGLDQSSRLLLRSLIPPGWNLNVGEGDALTGKVRQSRTYREMIQNVIKSCKKGLSSYKKSGIGVNFEGKDIDLDTAIGKASFDLDGIICRKGWGSAKVNLGVVMHDDYDFHYRSFKDVDNFKRFLVIAGNNLANIHQHMFVIHNYSITVSFSDHKRYTIFD